MDTKLIMGSKRSLAAFYPQTDQSKAAGQSSSATATTSTATTAATSTVSVQRPPTELAPLKKRKVRTIKLF